MFLQIIFTKNRVKLLTLIVFGYACTVALIHVGSQSYFLNQQHLYVSLGPTDHTPTNIQTLDSVAMNETNYKHSSINATCQNVLELMVNGKLQSKTFTKAEENDLETFLNHGFFLTKDNRSYQKPDHSCGNISYYGWRSNDPNAKLFRVLCDPKGKTPCCFNNQCVAKDVDECRCPKCYDLRCRVYAEAADWIPDDTRCPVNNASSACALLQGGTLHFYGDSLTRQVFLGMVTILNRTGLLRPGLAASNFSLCRNPYALLGECQELIDKTPSVCGGKVKLMYEQIRDLNDVPRMKKTAETLMGQRKSIIFFGGGSWMRNIHKTTKFATSLLTLLYMNGTSRGRWPKTVWAGQHSHGLFMSDSRIWNLRKKENNHMKKVVAEYGVPIFDSMNITKTARSTDGMHYGLGVNILKSQIYLNYIDELRRRGIWV